MFSVEDRVLYKMVGLGGVDGDCFTGLWDIEVDCPGRACDIPRCLALGWDIAGCSPAGGGRDNVARSPAAL